MTKMKMLFAALLLASLSAVPARAAVNARAVQKIVKEGLTTSPFNSGLLSSDTQTFTNDGRTILHFKKTGAGNATVTVTVTGTSQGLAVANLTVTVPATTGDVFTGPFPTSLFNDTSNNVSFTVSDTVGLSFEILRL